MGFNRLHLSSKKAQQLHNQVLVSYGTGGKKLTFKAVQELLTSQDRKRMNLCSEHISDFLLPSDPRPHGHFRGRGDKEHLSLTTCHRTTVQGTVTSSMCPQTCRRRRIFPVLPYNINAGDSLVCVTGRDCSSFFEQGFQK